MIHLSEYKNSNQEFKIKHRITSELLKAQKEGKIHGLFGRLGDLGAIDQKYDVAISEIGEVNNSGEPILVKQDGSTEKLVPLFREAAYTKIKKLVGETTPEDFEEMKEKVQKASDAAIAKNDKVIEYISQK